MTEMHMRKIHPHYRNRKNAEGGHRFNPTFNFIGICLHRAHSEHFDQINYSLQKQTNTSNLHHVAPGEKQQQKNAVTNELFPKATQAFMD